MTELLNFINRLNKLAALSGQQHGRFVLKINGQDYSRDVEYFRLSRIILTVWFIDNDTDKRHLLYKQDHSKPEGLEGKVMFVDFISSVLFDLLAIIVFTDEKRNFQDPKYGTDIEVIPVRNLILEGYGKDRTILLR